MAAIAPYGQGCIRLSYIDQTEGSRFGQVELHGGDGIGPDNLGVDLHELPVCRLRDLPRGRLRGIGQ